MRRARFTTALLVGALACAVGVPVAAADDPPVTVPTGTTPAPPPDPAPPPSKPKPQTQTHHATTHHSTPPSRPVTHVSTPVQPTYTPPAATPTRVSPVRTHRAARHVKVAKKRAVHKPKQTRVVVKPVPKPKTTPVSAPKSPSGATLAASATRTESSDWLRWFLLLAAATGLMAVSIGAVVGNGRIPVAVRRRRSPARDVVAELVARPPLPKAPARRPPSRPAPPPPAREATAEEPLPVAPPPPPPAPEPAAVAPAAAEPVAAPTEEFCEILVWRGYAKARFYARLDIESHEGDEFAVAESPTFRFRGNGTPDDTDAAHEAHEALVNRLIDKGWEPEDTTGPWYAVRFRRPLPSGGRS